MSIPLMPAPNSGPPPLPMFVGPPASGVPPPFGPTMSFAIPVPGQQGVQPPVIFPGTQPQMPVGQPIMPIPQPGMALVQPLGQPMMPQMMPQMMQPLMPQMMQSPYGMMQQPAASSYWPTHGAPQAGYAPLPMSAGVSGFPNPSGAPPSRPSAPTTQAPAHTTSPPSSPLRSMSDGATGRRVRFEDDVVVPNGTSEHTSIPATGTDGQGGVPGGQAKKRRIEDAIDWIHDHTVGRCQLCDEHGHMARNCPRLPARTTISGAPRANPAFLTEDQSKWQGKAGKLSYICQSIIPDPDCQSLSYEVMMQHLLEVLCENAHNTDLVYDYMQKSPFGWTWFCVRAVCDAKHSGSKVLTAALDGEAKCDYCANRGQLINFCLQIQPRKDQHALYREVATPKP